MTKFTEETGIKVTLDTYGSNDELWAKTDIGSSPAFANIDPQFIHAQTDPEVAYCLPYAWGNVGIVYNRAKTEGIKGFADMSALADKGEKIILLDDLRETIGIGHIMNGTSVNSTDEEEVTAAAQYIVDRAGAIAAFSYDSIPLVQSGDVAAAAWYVGANIFVKQTPDMIGYIIPKEGVTMYQENMCALADVPIWKMPKNSRSSICAPKSPR